MYTQIGNVNLIYFNPMRPIFNFKGLLGKLMPIKKPLNNFGDLLGPLVVKHILNQTKIHTNSNACNQNRLLTVGSILHLAQSGDTVWGSGKNGKVSETHHLFETLDVRAVRGPLTRDYLQEKGIYCPEIYGDPALLLPHLIPQLLEWRKNPAYDLTYIPNLNDFERSDPSPWRYNPRSPVMDCLKRIAQSRLVIGSSLHAIIVAESLGIPARFVISKVEHEFKYADYYHGTGRFDFKIAGTVKEALSLGGEKPVQFSPENLLAAFPLDLWEN
jgi:pyruvyltransferase